MWSHCTATAADRSGESKPRSSGRTGWTERHPHARWHCHDAVLLRCVATMTMTICSDGLAAQVVEVATSPPRLARRLLSLGSWVTVYRHRRRFQRGFCKKYNQPFILLGQNFTVQYRYGSAACRTSSRAIHACRHELAVAVAVAINC